MRFQILYTKGKAMLETVTRECVGKTIADVRYTYREDGTVDHMELSFSDGTEMGIGYTSDDDSLCSVMVPGPFSASKAEAVPCGSVARRIGDLYSIQLCATVQVGDRSEGMFLGGVQFRIVDGKPTGITTDATEWNHLLETLDQESL